MCGAIGLHAGIIAAACFWPGAPGAADDAAAPMSVSFFSGGDSPPAPDVSSPPEVTAEMPAPEATPDDAAPEPVAEQIPPVSGPDITAVILPAPKREAAAGLGNPAAATPSTRSGRRATRAGGGLGRMAGLPGAGGGVRYRFAPAPPYPAEALRRKIEGLVLLSVVVDTEGRAQAVALRRSSGSALLDETALRAVRGWRFEPARVSGASIVCQVEVPVRFRLQGS